MMNPTWLEDFLALTKSGNFSRAAQERHMTQPAFSRRVRALEEWLGVDLFDRTHQPLGLTPTGQWFVSVAQKVLVDIEQLPAQAQAISQAHSNTLRFAATHALSFTFLPKWLRTMESRIAVGGIELVSDVFQRCESLMQHGKTQFLLTHAHGLVPSTLDTLDFPSITIGTEALIPVSAPDSKTGRPLFSLTSDGQAPVPLLAYSAGSGLGRIIRAIKEVQLAKLPVETVFTADLATVLKTMVLERRGLAWLPKGLIEEELNSSRLVHAADGSWDIELEVRLYRQPEIKSAAANALWQAIPTPKKLLQG